MPDLPSTRPRSRYDKSVTREQSIAAYRAFADLLEANPDMPAPMFPEFELYVSLDYGEDGEVTDNRRERLAAILHALPGTYSRHEVPGGYMEWQGDLEGVLVSIRTEREAVCRKVVVGVEPVVIPAREAQPATPAEPERIEEREVVRWECEPIMPALRAREHADA